MSNQVFLAIIIFIVIIIIIAILVSGNNDTQESVIVPTVPTVPKKRGCPINKHMRSKCPSHYSDQKENFYHMFDLPKHEVDDSTLLSLSQTMFKNIESSDLNHKIPAGYTFLGQFLAHDITFDHTANFDDEPDTKNHRTPNFDLDSVYDGGPESYNGKKLKYNAKYNDLLRDAKGVAIIGDPRNDENCVIAQLQLIFIKLHNKLVDKHKHLSLSQIRRMVVRVYHKIILNDFLPRFVDSKVLDTIRKKGNVYYKGYGMPYEFSIAACRFGHATLLNEYRINKTTVLNFDQLFSLRKNLKFDWNYLFGSTAEHSKKITPTMAPALADMKIEKPKGLIKNSLALRNLLRAKQFGLPSGQTLSKYFRIKPLSCKELSDFEPVLENLGLHEDCPLWYYMLAESKIRAKGHKLGKIASIIVGEVLMKLLKLSKYNIRCQDDVHDTYLNNITNMDELIKFALN